jgi:hypothetical protein
MLDREGEIRQKEVLTCGLYNEKWSEGLTGRGASLYDPSVLKGQSGIQLGSNAIFRTRLLCLTSSFASLEDHRLLTCHFHDSHSLKVGL